MCWCMCESMTCNKQQRSPYNSFFTRTHRFVCLCFPSQRPPPPTRLCYHDTHKQRLGASNLKKKHGCGDMGSRTQPGIIVHNKQMTLGCLLISLHLLVLSGAATLVMCCFRPSAGSTKLSRLCEGRESHQLVVFLSLHRKEDHQSAPCDRN